MTGRSEAAAERHSDRGPGRLGSRGFAIAACALVVVATAASFSQSLRNEFVYWDDHIAIQTNPHIRGLGPENIRWMFTTFHLGPYQPLAWFSLAADYALWGLNPFGFHLTSLVIHAVNGLLVLALSLALLEHAGRARVARLGVGALANAGDDGGGGGAARGPLLIGATISALLFAIHPLRVESVAWATERRDVLMGFFLLLSSLAYVRAVRPASGATARRRGLVLSQALYLLALLSKSSALGFPIVLLLIDAVVLRRLPLDPRRWFDAASRPVLIEKLPYVLMAALLAVVALRGQEEARAIRDAEEAGIERRVGTAIYSPAFYLWKLVLPTGLSPLYEAPRDFARMRPAVIASAIVLGAITIVALSQRTRRPGLAAAWLAYAVLLAPVSGLVPIGSHVAADRYTYVAMLPFALLAGGAVIELLRRGAAIADASAGTTRRRAILSALVAVALFALLGLATARQTRVWRDSLSLWEHALRVDPASAIGHYGRGFALWSLGQEEAAIASYREAIRLMPDYADAHNNLGTILAQRGVLDEAEQHFLAAERGFPGNAISQYNLGIIAGKRGRLDEAAARYRRALALRPEMSSARINLAQVLTIRGDADSARALLDEGLRLAPGDSSLVRAIESAPTTR